MSCSLSTSEEHERHKPESSTPTLDDVQVPAISGLIPNPKREEREQREQPVQVDQSPGAVSSPPSATQVVDESKQTFITSIRAADVAVGLRRIPAGFYIAVQHSNCEWRTENKHVPTTDDMEWHELIPIPFDLSATICIGVYASFEVQPMLGDGEQLRKLTVTVEQLLSRSETDLPFTFFPREGDVVSPCSSIFLSVTRQTFECNGSPLPMLLGPHRSATGPSGQVEEATNQGHNALSHYRKHGVQRDLERSLERFEHALNICPLDHPGRAAAHSNLAMVKFIHFRVTGINPSFDVPLTLYRNALAARPAGHPDRYSTIVHLASVHISRFEMRRNASDATQAEILLQEALDLGPAERDRKRTAILLLQLQSVGPIQQSGQSCVEWGSDSGFMGDDLSSAASQLFDLFDRFGDLAALEQAISLLEEVVRSTSVWDRQYSMGLINLGSALGRRFERLGDPRDLEHAISKLREAASLTFDGHSDKVTCLSCFGGILYLRFQHFGELSDLEEAISMLKDAIDLSFIDHPISLGHLGISLLSRFQCLREPSDLEESISRLKDAVELTPDRHPFKPIYLCNLAASIAARFQCYGSLSDLEQAISNQRDANDRIPDGHVGKPGHLNNLGALLFLHFNHRGDLSDLDQAIFRLEDAVNLTPDRDIHKPGRLNNFGSSFLTRFKHLAELSDLDKAISALTAALELIPDGHPNRHRILVNLGVAFDSHFVHVGEPGDIEKAISNLRDAVCLTPDGHPDKPRCLHQLGNSLRLRFTHLGKLDDIEQAISSLADAMRLTRDDRPLDPAVLNNIANCFLARFQHLGELGDLEQTISRYTDAVELIPDGHPDKPLYLGNLGSAFLYRFECLRELNDIQQAMLLYSRAARDSVGPTSVRFEASQEWILCARILRHPSLLDAYSTAIILLPQLAWIGFPLAGRYKQLQKGVDVAREAAAVALDAEHPETAVEWLDQGRSIVWGELFQLRGSSEVLESAHPDYARRLRELSIALEHASVARERSIFLLSEEMQNLDYPETGILEKEVERHRTLAILRDKLLREIRELPGFERFLLHKEFSKLRASAHSGPVVIINAAETRCDALIVLAGVDHVIHVPLPNFTLERSKGLQNMLNSLLGPTRGVIPEENREGKRATRGRFGWEFVLSTLWGGVVKPVLEALGFSTPGDLVRIFWCPTGPFAFLPIHAAGLYGTQASILGQKLSDFVVSSYIPTLSILIPPTTPNVAPRRVLRFLTVRQPSSDGQMSLSGVDTEMKYIKAVVQNSPLTRTALIESSIGTVEEVLTLMKDADWVHFACHGIQDTDMPVNSGLCLADQRRLKLSDIISISRPRGGLAFLSACQTATGDKDLSDEAVHIAAGMLFAGYGGVIGTMWSISDRLAPRVAKDVYQQLFGNGAMPDYRDAARALHDAVERLRESDASFVEWIPFIHVGL